MKKNKMMRFASALLVATLLSTSVISGTFAKYVTTGTGSDSARVAKWGVSINANGTSFATSYKNDEEISTNAIGSVSSVNNGGSDSKKLIAPGTSGELVECTISGTPEVAVKVTYDATVDLTGWTVTGDFDGNGITDPSTETNVEYCPIIFRVDTVDIKMDSTNPALDTLDKFKNAVELAIEGYTAEYDVNQNLANESTVATPDVSWRWPIDVDNTKDTLLGEKAADGNAPEISVSITTTVSQID